MSKQIEKFNEHNWKGLAVAHLSASWLKLWLISALWQLFDEHQTKKAQNKPKIELLNSVK